MYTFQVKNHLPTIQSLPIFSKTFEQIDVLRWFAFKSSDVFKWKGTFVLEVAALSL